MWERFERGHLELKCNGPPRRRQHSETVYKERANKEEADLSQKLRLVEVIGVEHVSALKSQSAASVYEVLDVLQMHERLRQPVDLGNLQRKQR